MLSEHSAANSTVSSLVIQHTCKAGLLYPHLCKQLTTAGNYIKKKIQEVPKNPQNFGLAHTKHTSPRRVPAVMHKHTLKFLLAPHRSPVRSTIEHGLLHVQFTHGSLGPTLAASCADFSLPFWKRSSLPTMSHDWTWQTILRFKVRGGGRGYSNKNC